MVGFLNSRNVSPPSLPFGISRYGVNSVYRTERLPTVLPYLLHLLLMTPHEKDRVSPLLAMYYVRCCHQTGTQMYPRSSFYPLSFRRPTSNGRITNFCFRNCATGRSCSKTGFCVCTSSAISIRAKPIFVNASVTFLEAPAPGKLPTRSCSCHRFHGDWLEFTQHKGGISLVPEGSHLC